MPMSYDQELQSIRAKSLIYTRQIVPGSANTVAIDLIANHIRDQLKVRTFSHRTVLTSLAGDRADAVGSEALPSSVVLLEQTAQLKVRRFFAVVYIG